MSARVFEEVERERAQEISKSAFEEQAAALRMALVEAQRALAEADFPVIVLFAGVDGAGKGETVNLLTEWLDPRRIVTHAYDRLTEEEGQRPEFWRYWRDLPERGRFGLFLSAWYSAPPARPRLRAHRAECARPPARAHRGVRANARGRRRADPQVLDAPQPRGAAEAA